ncbi:MAG: hypothetical protein H6825_14670 [Planctomycetes bacterium]|nr:hypothetical protein [Planctomycetota bacterium]
MRALVPILSCAVLVGASLLAAGTRPAEASSSGSRPAACVDKSCKPTGPVDARLVQLSSQGPRVELEVRVRPVLELESLAWHLELPSDASLVEGVADATASTARASESTARVVLAMPDDAAWRRVVLVADGVFRGSDESGATFPEPFETRTELTWGELPLPAPLRATRDGETGAPIEVVAQPTSHRTGR